MGHEGEWNAWGGLCAPAGAAPCRTRGPCPAPAAEIYDPTAKRYITVLAAALPHLSLEEVSLRMAFLVGTYLFMLNDLGRLSDLSDGQVTTLEKEALLDHLQRFLAAGLRAE